MKIRINHIDKIEGHMGFEAALYNGNVQEAFMDVIEGARLIEGMILGRPYEDVPVITARICGVCPVVHNLASIKALESALGVKPSDITILFRKLLLLGEIIQSHILHTFFLSAPDFLGDTNDLNLIKKYPKEAEAVFLARDFATKIMRVVGGRAVHPIASEVGGFKILPDKKILKEILSEADPALAASIAIFKWINKIKLPAFGVDLRPISMTNSEYEFYDGQIVSGQGLNVGLEKFYHSIRELQKPQSPVKQVELYNRHYLVGALARLLNQSKMLNPEAKKLFEKLPKEKMKVNPFYNLFAQAVETVHCIEETEKIIKKLLSLNIPREDRQEIKLRAGEGLGAVEAPRGTLVHYYKLDKNGKILASNIITPTAQFLNDLEHSLKAYLPQISGLPEAERAQKIKALVRAYDPCISCATH
ncbi:MAG: Ni/Fe hydrogenase subunit alpha [bacterium]